MLEKIVRFEDPAESLGMDASEESYHSQLEVVAGRIDPYQS